MIRFSKKKTSFISLFLFLISINAFLACSQHLYQNTEIKGKNISVSDTLAPDLSIDEFVAPYKKHIDEDLSKVLSHSPITMDKSKGKWETTIGNLFAEATVEIVNPVFQKRYQKNIDACMLNHGGIRSVISEGDVTTRAAFEVMPFENEAVVLELKGEQIIELANYMLANKKPHPLAGIFIHIDAKTQQLKNVYINGKIVSPEKTYLIVTNDYLAQGGDSMVFFTKAVHTYTIDYKLRNVLIEYFKKHPELPVITTKHIIEEGNE